MFKEFSFVFFKHLQSKYLCRYSNLRKYHFKENITLKLGEVGNCLEIMCRNNATWGMHFCIYGANLIPSRMWVLVESETES